MDRPRGTTARLKAVAAMLLAGTALGAAAAQGAPAGASVDYPGIVDVKAFLGYQRAAMLGTGIVLGRFGEVITNNHVIRGATRIEVVDVDTGKSYSAAVAGYDLSADVAVLKVAHPAGLGQAAIGDSSSVAVGDPVTAIGNAGGKGGAPTVSSGTVVALGQMITALTEGGSGAERLTGLIETTTELQPGDSGGPLVDGSGDVVGMNTAGPGSRSSSRKGASDGYAVTINRAVSIANRVATHRATSTLHIGPTAFLGVDIQPSGFGSGAPRGALVAGVLPGTPAGRIGLAPGDVITRVAGQEVWSSSRLTSLLLLRSPGMRIRLDWHDRDGNAHHATALLSHGPPQ